MEEFKTNIIRADEDRRIINFCLKPLGCCCPHSDIGSSEEWDRKHANYCPITIIFVLENRAKGWEEMDV